MRPRGRLSFALRVLAVLLAAPSLAVGAPATGSGDGDWHTFAHVQGISVEARIEASGFNRHRAATRVCADLMTLEAFVEDIRRFPDWVPDTRVVEVLEREPGRVLYYVETAAPWPLRPRDMVYELLLLPMDHPDEIRIRMTGLPEAVPERKGAVRMAAADGEWRLVSDGAGVEVRFELYVDPGKVPRYFANRRLSRTLGTTLANLQATFPCVAASGSDAGSAP